MTGIYTKTSRLPLGHYNLHAPQCQSWRKRVNPQKWFATWANYGGIPPTHMQPAILQMTQVAREKFKQQDAYTSWPTTAQADFFKIASSVSHHGLSFDSSSQLISPTSKPASTSSA